MEEAGLAQSIQDSYRDRGFQYITALTAAWSAPPTLDELQNFAAEFGLSDVPALSVPEHDQSYPDSEYYRYEHDMGVQTVVHLAPDLSVLSVDEYIFDPAEFLD